MFISNLILASGQNIPLTKINVLIGPNNMGKSLALYEITIKTSNAKSTDKIIKSLEVNSDISFEEDLNNFNVSYNKDGIHIQVTTLSNTLTSSQSQAYKRGALKDLYDRNIFDSPIMKQFIAQHIVYLNVQYRLHVTEGTNAKNPLMKNPDNSLQMLHTLMYEESDIFNIFRDLFNEIFNMDIQFFESSSNISLRISDDFGKIPEDFHERARYLNQFSLINDQGDGFKSFTGLLLTILLSKGKIICLDEPELFLHPAQARQLGAWLSNHVENVPGQLIMATHSPDLLAGLVTTSQGVSVYRVKRKKDTTTFYPLSSDNVNEIANNPLLSSQRVIESLFYKGVIVCEGDSDKAVYQEVSSRKLVNHDYYFTHLFGIEHIPNILYLLRDAEIKTGIIVDFDVFDPRQEHILKICSEIPEIDFKKIESLYKILKDELENIITNKGDITLEDKPGKTFKKERKENWKPVKENGIRYFDKNPHLSIYSQIIEECKLGGLFIVPNGELESWNNYSEQLSKQNWTVRTLTELHEPSSSVSFSELISFMGEVLTFLENT